MIWSKFTLATPADSSHFLDIDFQALSTPSADGVAYIFDNSGNIVYFADDKGGTAGPGLPQFSLGASGSRTYGTNDVAFDGNTPVGGSAGLPAGTYYLGAALYATQDLGALLTGHRWHVRGTSGSSLTLGADLYTGQTGTNPCCRNDYNGDGDVGTDADIEAFFACLAGNCCPTCPPNADFNCDGDIGTDADIESFFRILGGGNC